MAEQENKELSMAEILASIRKILEESGADEALRRKEAEEEVFELQPSMIVREEPAPAAKPEIPSAVPGRLISEARKTRVADEETAEYFAGANRHFAAAEEFSAAGADGFSLPGVIVAAGKKKLPRFGPKKIRPKKKHSGGRNGFAAGSFRRGTR